MSLNKNVESQEEKEGGGSSVFLWMMILFVILVLMCFLYLWDSGGAVTNTTGHVEDKQNKVVDSLAYAPPFHGKSPTSERGGGGDFDKGCSDICTKRESSRKEKFGGDLLNFQDVLNLAEEAMNQKVLPTLREDYGEYFEKMFVDATNGTNDDEGTHSWGMRAADLDGPSRDRMKRKMKIKVLKMMASVQATERNVQGCDCVGKTGSIDDSGVDEAIPDFYEKYVFANGGHSNAAGHGNMFSESYTAVFGRDVRPIWEAIGIEMIDRNHAMGAMSGSPFISTCAKEVFGTDVDFLAWNYGMTNGKVYAAAHYIYRGAMIPSHPAFVFVDWIPGAKLGRSFAPIGLSMFRTRVDRKPVSMLPDMTPDGIPIPDQEAQKIPEMARDLKCNGRLEGKEQCFRNKWSCNDAKKKAGVDCICPHVGKRTSWHMGYRMHALQGHLIGIPFMEMLLEALRELAATPPTPDSDQLLADLQKEEDADFQVFMESPLLDVLGKEYDALGNKTDPLYETWFRGPSICRTSYLPSQSRFLGLMTDSEKTGDVAIYTHETYDTGYYMGGVGAGKINFLGDTPPAGQFSIIGNIGTRSGSRDINTWEVECPAIVMPDYLDTFYAPLLDGKASIRFPNQKEKEYYGYDPKLFKGVIALIFPLWGAGCKGCAHPYDLVLADFLNSNVTMAVNSNPVKNIRVVSNNVMVLEKEYGNPFWEPDPQTEDYTIDFQVVPDATQYHLRFGNFILM